MSFLNRSLLLFLLVAGVLTIAIPCLASGEVLERSLTIYTRDLTLVRETRSLQLDKGEGSVALGSLPPGVVAGSEVIETLKGNAATTRSLQFVNNLFDLDKYWASRVGETVSLPQSDSTSLTGILRRATSSHLFLEVEGGLKPVSRSAADKELTIETIPTGLVTEPSILWNYTTKQAGARTIQLSYLTTGLTWNGAHKVVQESRTASFLPGFTVTNNTGMVLEYASLDLVAGEVHLAGDRRRVDRLNPKPGAVKADGIGKTGDLRHWQMPASGHLTLGSTTFQPLGEVSARAAERLYEYDATIYDDRVAAKLSFTLNSAIPAGVVRVFQKGITGLLFAGEDSMDDTPAGSQVELTLGPVFDITAERTRLSEGRDGQGGTSQVFRVALGNSGDKLATVRVLERVFGEWDISSATLNGAPVDLVRVDARTARFDVPIGAGSTVELEYEIRYVR